MNTQDRDFQREYVPYENAASFISKRIPRREKVQLSFVAIDFSSSPGVDALCDEIRANREWNFEITKTKIADDPLRIRIHGISAKGKVPSPKEFHLLAGWLWCLTAHYGGRLDSLAFNV